MRTLVIAAALLISSAAVAADVEHAFQSVVPRGAVRRVVIEVSSGTFTVRNGASDRLSIAGVISRDYDSTKERQWAQQVVNDISVEYYVSGSEAVLRPKFGPNAGSWRARRFNGVELRIDVPPGTALEFRTAAGEINLSGDFGHVDADLRAGEINVRMPKIRVRELRASARVGEVRAHLGDVVVTREGVLPKSAKYFNASGTSDVNLHVTAGEVTVTLVP